MYLANAVYKHKNEGLRIADAYSMTILGYFTQNPAYKHKLCKSMTGHSQGHSQGRNHLAKVAGQFALRIALRIALRCE